MRFRSALASGRVTGALCGATTAETSRTCVTILSAIATGRVRIAMALGGAPASTTTAVGVTGTASVDEPTIFERALIADAVRDMRMDILAVAAAKYGQHVVEEAHRRAKAMERGTFLVREPRLQCKRCDGSGVVMFGPIERRCIPCCGAGKMPPQLWTGAVILGEGVLSVEASSAYIGRNVSNFTLNRHDQVRQWRSTITQDGFTSPLGKGSCKTLGEACAKALACARRILG